MLISSSGQFQALRFHITEIKPEELLVIHALVDAVSDESKKNPTVAELLVDLKAAIDLSGVGKGDRRGILGGPR